MAKSRKPAAGRQKPLTKTKPKPAVPFKAPSKPATGQSKPGVVEVTPARKNAKKVAKRAKKRQSAKPTTRPPHVDTRPWFVLCVETGLDARVRKAIIRKKRIEGLEKVIGRCYSPFQIQEKILPKAGEELARGKALEAQEARRAGNLKSWELTGGDYSSDSHAAEDMLVRIFPAKSKTKGKVGNGWEWVVRREKSTEERRVLIREKKFPGYLIIRMKMSPETFHLVRGVRGVQYFLKSNEGPVPLETDEAAELLIEQHKSNSTLKGMKSKVELDFKVGDKVVQKDGVWSNQTGTVTSITGADNNPVIGVEYTVFNVPVAVQLKHWDVRKCITQSTS